MRGMYIVGSFHNVKIIGRRATRQEAPILAMAPHSTFFDSMVPVWLDPLSVLAKGETATIPFFGSMFEIQFNYLISLSILSLFVSILKYFLLNYRIYQFYTTAVCVARRF